jgi:simple sugar transport system permease protein
MRLEPIPAPSLARRLGMAALAGGLVLALASALAAAAGADPLSVLGQIATGAMGSRLAMTETLKRATPLIFTGLAVAIAFRARLWNIGAEAQLYAGAILTVVLGTGALGLPAPLPPMVLALAAASAGALTLLGPALLKTRFGVDEVVTTLLLNFIMLLVVSMLLEGPLRDPMALGWPQSPALLPEARLPRSLFGLRLHWGFAVALLAAVLVAAIERRSTLGFAMRAVGLNAEAARFAGIGVGGVLVRTAVLSGGLAGLAGWSEVAGLKGSLTLDLSPGFGYTGIIVAMLAGLNPLGVVPAALFTAGIFVGADSMSRAAGVPSYIADILLALALLATLAAIQLSRYRLVRS